MSVHIHLLHLQQEDENSEMINNIDEIYRNTSIKICVHKHIHIYFLNIQPKQTSRE